MNNLNLAQFLIFTFLMVLDFKSTSAKSLGLAKNYKFTNPTDLVFDRLNNLFISDLGANVIYKITPEGELFLIAGIIGKSGSVDGKYNEALFNKPTGIAFDSKQNLYVLDSENSAIRKITKQGIVTTILGSVKEKNSTTNELEILNRPYGGIIFDEFDNMFFSDTHNHVIKRFSPSGNISIFAGIIGKNGDGNGPTYSTYLHSPNGIDLDEKGNFYFANYGGNNVKKIDSGNIYNLAGKFLVSGYKNAINEQAEFGLPGRVRFNKEDKSVLVADHGFHMIRKIKNNYEVIDVAGNSKLSGFKNGKKEEALFCEPSGMTIDKMQNIIVADVRNGIIRKIDLEGNVSTLYGVEPKNSPCEKNIKQ